jgi:DNA-directed RNA polymerase subunit RPC12/RpoP
MMVYPCECCWNLMSASESNAAICCCYCGRYRTMNERVFINASELVRWDVNIENYYRPSYLSSRWREAF